MVKSDLAFKVVLSASMEEAVTLVSEELTSEDFEVLARIDMDVQFKENIGRDFRPYTILTVSSTPLANAAFSENSEIGLFLPGRIVLESIKPRETVVLITNPLGLIKAVGFDENEVIRLLAKQGSKHLGNVAKRLGTS